MRRALLLVLLGALGHVPVAGAWSWPADGPVLRPFALGADPYAAGQHRGIDIGAPTGTPVAAPASGRVSFAGTVPKGGKTLTIETADGYSVTLVHLGSIAVKRGADVGERQPVGTIGPTGEPEGPKPYVHLGVRVTAEPEGYVDPLLLLPKRVPVVGAGAGSPAPVPGSGEERAPADGIAVPDSLGSAVPDPSPPRLTVAMPEEAQVADAASENVGLTGTTTAGIAEVAVVTAVSVPLAAAPPGPEAAGVASNPLSDGVDSAEQSTFVEGARPGRAATGTTSAKPVASELRSVPGSWVSGHIARAHVRGGRQAVSQSTEVRRAADLETRARRRVGPQDKMRVGSRHDSGVRRPSTRDGVITNARAVVHGDVASGRPSPSQPRSTVEAGRRNATHVGASAGASGRAASARPVGNALVALLMSGICVALGLAVIRRRARGIEGAAVALSPRSVEDADKATTDETQPVVDERVSTLASPWVWTGSCRLVPGRTRRPLAGERRCTASERPSRRASPQPHRRGVAHAVRPDARRRSRVAG